MLQDIVNTVLDQVGREPLRDLLFTAIEPKDLDEHLARLSYYVAPSYLPFATDDSGTLVFHLYPGRDLEQSPILYVPNDEQEARFVCNRLATLPSALWLWVCTYFRKKPEVLRHATDAITAGIPNARPVPEVLWSFIDDDPCRWYPRSEQANKAWEMANVGHPFAGVPTLSRRMESEEAFPLLEPFVASRCDVPELVSALLDCRAKAGFPRQADEIIKVISAEAWREFHCYLNGYWRDGGEGICEWDCTLRNIEDPKSVLSGTPFEALIGHPDTYSGKDKEGPRTLLRVAEAFRKDGDRQGELRQKRNAATLSLITFGEYSTEDSMAIAQVCDAIAPDSLAATVARESARVHEQGP